MRILPILFFSMSCLLFGCGMRKYEGKAFLFDYKNFKGEYYNQKSSLGLYYFIDKVGYMNYIANGYNYFDTTYFVDSTSFDLIDNSYRVKSARMLHKIVRKEKFNYDLLTKKLYVRNDMYDSSIPLYLVDKDISVNSTEKVFRTKKASQYIGDTLIEVRRKKFVCWVFKTCWKTSAGAIIDAVGEIGDFYCSKDYIDKKNLLLVRNEFYNYKDSNHLLIVPERSFIRELNDIVPMDYNKLSTSFKEISDW